MRVYINFSLEVSACRGRCEQKMEHRRGDSYLHEVHTLRSLENGLHGAQEFFCFLSLLIELQRLLGVFPHIHHVSALQHLHGLLLVCLQQCLHPPILSSHTILQLRHRVLQRNSDFLQSQFHHTEMLTVYHDKKNRKLCLRTQFWNEMFSYCFLNQCLRCITQNWPWQIIYECIFSTDAETSHSQRRCLLLPKAQKGYFSAAVKMKAHSRSRHWRSEHKLHFTFISVLSDSSLLSCSSMFCTRPSSRSCCLISMACAKKTRR